MYMANKTGKEKIMSERFTEKELTDYLKDHTVKGKLSSLYQENHINKRVLVIDSLKKKQYEFITEWLLEHNVKELYEQNIEPISRQESYKSPEHKPMTDGEKESIHKQLRKEDLFARSLLYSSFDNIGEIIDYQTPIKDSNDDKGVGEVDLLSYNKSKNQLFLLELKLKTNDDTMLHTILQINTYFHQIDKEKLKEDFKYPDAEIRKGILVFKGSCQHTDFMESEIIKQLAINLDITISLLDLVNNELTTP
jgi:hypothetical protein